MLTVSVKVYESWIDPVTFERKGRKRWITMLDTNKILGQISVIEGLIVQVQDKKIQAKLKAQILILKSMLSD